MVWIGIDDTDSLEEGCTTYVMFKIVERLLRSGYLISRPSLVRLNPNVPWKTRGNGALALRTSKGNGVGEVIGRYRGLPIHAKESNGEADQGDVKKIADITRRVIEDLSIEGSDPGCVISQRKGPEWFYWKCVRGLVSKDEAVEVIESMGAHTIKEGRGLIGGLAAVSWPSVDKTFELIAYRKPERWGSKRVINEKSVKKIELEFSETFDSFDLENGSQRIAPNSPCPLLYGIRGLNPRVLKEAKRVVKAEEEDGWIIFESNQGTDDHLQGKRIDDVRGGESVMIEGVISSEPRRDRGGHLFLEITDETGGMTCAAFEPTKKFRNVLSDLTGGDRVRAFGGVKKDTINLEKIELLDLVPIYEKVNPACPQCGRKMKSMGNGRGYKCRCGHKAGEELAVRFKRQRPKTGFYEVPVRARKHLSKPIKLQPKNLYSSHLSTR